MTITAAPSIYSSVNSSLVWTCYDVNSLDISKLNYKYIGEVWIGGVRVYSSSVYPRPSDSRGIFDFGSVIREYINATLQPQMGSGSFSIDVIVKVKETYLVGSVQTTSVSTDDASRTFFNFYQTRLQEAITPNAPATSRPRIIEISTSTTTFYLPYFATTTAPVSVVFTGLGIGITTIITPTAANTILNINIAQAQTYNYTVLLGGVTYQVVIVDEVIYKKYAVHFLSQFGGFETMLFQKASQRTTDIERKEWQQLQYRVDSAGVVSGQVGNMMHPQRSSYGVRVREKLKISTDLLSDQDFAWLAQLVYSPLVYLEDTGVLYPVIITASNYEYKEYVYTGAINNVVIDLEFGLQFKTQYQ